MRTFPLLSRREKLGQDHKIKLPENFPIVKEVIAFTYPHGIGYTNQNLFDEINKEDSN